MVEKSSRVNSTKVALKPKMSELGIQWTFPAETLDDIVESGGEIFGLGWSNIQYRTFRVKMEDKS